ncbi:MAG: class I SAM-dependent methyltransferase [Elusimicrobiota bacterium]|jgi:SAM-dependent methyltransferase|nr:class I SAM-dependent methyltransferase [Elusimicrobiota bacterium]
MKMVEAKSIAQKMVFAPLTFQAIRTMLNGGLLKAVDDSGKDGINADELKKKTNLSDYAVETLIDVAVNVNLLTMENGRVYSTKIAQTFLYDDMTRINMDFVHDVCYQGVFYLQDSFLSGKPEGLRIFGDWTTVYEGLSQLPPQVQKSWLAFDHFYSDNAFEDTIKIIIGKKPKRIFDIGCNTAKFEICLLKTGYDGKIILLDLPQQLKKADANLKANGFNENNFELYPINVLDEKTVFPKEPDAILMSQFLDCFSKEQIISILKKASAGMDKNCALYILEPFWDKQRFEAAKLSLTHTSLYFTAIANGNSKIYKFDDMEKCVQQSGLKVSKIHDNIGRCEYTLIECLRV